MNLQINGEQVQVPESIETIADLINYFDIKNPVFIVEHNENILEKSDHNQTVVKDGDKIEFVQFVGGG
ncbi:MAG TPA: sulfur carrier protein ThiS [Bacillota bacterium]|nr:sulfur carrier protein ThiS [Bacillota bacterium]